MESNLSQMSYKFYSARPIAPCRWHASIANRLVSDHERFAPRRVYAVRRKFSHAQTDARVERIRSLSRALLRAAYLSGKPARHRCVSERKTVRSLSPGIPRSTLAYEFGVC